MSITKCLFGKSNVVQITLLDSQRLELTPSADSPTIYLFSSLPNRTAAAAGTGAVQTVSAWTGTGSDRAITLTAIADPEPTSATRIKEYYLGINFTLAVSGQVQTLIELITFERPLAQIDNLSINAQDAKNIYPAISSYLSDSQINNYIAGSTEELKLELSGKGIDWATIKNPRDYKRVIIYRAIADASLSQIQEQDDKFSKRYDTYLARATKVLASIDAILDTDKDGIPDAVTPTKPNYYIMQR